MSSNEGRVKPLPVAELIVPRWDAARSEQTLAGVHRKRARRARSERVLMLASAALLLLLVVSFVVRGRMQARGGVALEGRNVLFGDGSSVRLLDAASVLDVGAASEASVEVALRSGAAEFEITPNPKRRFIVQAGPAEISVLGTHFRVTRSGERVRVEVTHGRVSVKYAAGARLLTDGESNWFPPAELADAANAPASAAASATSSAEEPAPELMDGASAAASAAPTTSAPDANFDRGRFLAHATQREYAQAYALIERSPEVVGSSASDLLLAADAARFSGHPAEATKFLQRITREHAHESTAPLAAFTLGRLYLSQLAEPAKAADAFALALKLAPAGALAEDALAREVEAASAAGQRDRAQNLAREYERRFAHGRRLDSVQKAAGLVGDSGTNR